MHMQTRAITLHPASVKRVDGTKWGYINKYGKFVIKPMFDQALDFQKNGLAVVEKDSLFGLINESENYVVLPQYNYINDFSEGRAAVLEDNGYSVINEQGKKLTSKHYQFIGQYQDHRALYSIYDGDQNLYGYLDLDGNEVIPANYKSASDFLDEQATVQLNEQTSAVINPSGEVLQTYPYSTVNNLGAGLFSFKKTADYSARVGLMDVKGNEIIPPRYTWIQPFEDNRAVVTTAEENQYPYGLIDTKGNTVIKPSYNDIQSLGNDRIAVGKAINPDAPYQGSIYAIADINGKLFTEFMYTTVLPFEGNYASASDGKRTFFITKNGTLATGLPVLKGSGTLTFEGDLIKATINGRVSYYTREGKLVWKQNTVIPLNRQYRVIEKEYTPREGYYVYYPQIDGMPKFTVQKRVNEQLKKLSIEPKMDDELLEYTYSADYIVEFFKKDLLVLELEAYQYPLGAAHGMPFQSYPHINLINGRFYKLEDLFKKDSDYVKVLSDIIGEQIKNDEQYSYVFPDVYKGISPDQPFYVTEDALYIYFAPYEIGPYAAGFPTFKIPYGEIDDIINKKGEFWESFH